MFYKSIFDVTHAIFLVPQKIKKIPTQSLTEPF